MPDHLNKDPALARKTTQEIESLVREEHAKLLAALISQLGDFQLAEDALQDGIESALIHWQRNGIPRSPAGWLLQTARRKAIDRLRRNKNFASKSHQITHDVKLNALMQMDSEEMAMRSAPPISDERLALIFTCCHPAIGEKSRIALTLHTLGGLSTGEIARAFLDKQSAMAQRLVRTKRKILSAKIPYAVPKPEQWNERLQTVLNVLYLIFNEGYFSGSTDGQMRVNLSNEAVRLTRILLELRPEEAETEGLLALMLLHDSRREARHDATGSMIALAEQNRNIWDQEKIHTGLTILQNALERQTPGPYQIQAAISALHAKAPDHNATDWQQIVHLYQQLHHLHPTPVIELNRAVALSYASGANEALKPMHDLKSRLSTYQPFYAAYADILQRTGQIEQAEKAYNRAIELSEEETTRLFLQRKLGAMLRAN